ncbi:SLATT domain-containing protein, partial [bacterium]
IGIPLIIINVITGSVLFYVLTEGANDWVKFVPLWLTLIAALLSSFQTYLNLPRRVEGHRKIANRYLSIMKKCDRLLGYLADGLIDDLTLIDKLELLGLEADEINILAENFPTSDSDYNNAKAGIEAGEENYTSAELNL